MYQEFLDFIFPLAEGAGKIHRQAIHREEILRYIQKLRTELFIL